ncbi:PH domain-containing protein [Priestia taiwanensis]|uniref:Membrane protein n=1 Tax=Priestia taiwanensis TaxID=1347902 RepID=A0A917AIT5_9BACI|nr:PH domain-containing protein [Priestia taiwanensis]MBM7361437.1 membrane protein YdbS with pleckstrin-like domain [Priestia taiwanensis]GGE54148.1 membrane protein [Priestia taiwanensis]
MGEELTGKLDKNIFHVWKFNTYIGLAIELAVVAGYGACVYFFNWWMLPLYIMLVLLPIGFVIERWTIPPIKYRHYGYEIRDDEVEIQHGVFVVKRMIIPMVRIQNIETEQGPIMKKYNLASLHISTAATKHEVKGLAVETATELRQKIAQLAKVSDEDV